ncbi:pathogen-associated molecular patterns-induced protein A70-like [Cornus florida]|uniref:pathogen-associated molecular patterns-induced protein A70-like n=1 Tax=Cornus florida TaxID=4283 RepID=UPI0028A19139|nr:pathogen-associated molecular patterns-induced protein A70-like [Cornus florida]
MLIWDSMTSWFTPTILFVLLNLVIVTIAFTTSLANRQKRNQTQNDPHQPQPIARSTSLLQRFKSINLYSYRSQEPSSFTTQLNNLALDSDTHYPPQHTHQPQTLEAQTQEPETQKTETQFVSEQISDEDEEEEEEDDNENQHTMDEIYSKLTSHHTRTRSETKPASGKVPVKLSEKMRKSASAKSVFGHFKEEDIVETRRPATVRERKAEPDEEVDAKADDFINRFKQQLKLQRLDSLLRYRR